MGMGRRNCRRDGFRMRRNNQIACYGCKQHRHMRSECLMNKKAKKDEKKKKAMMDTLV